MSNFGENLKQIRVVKNISQGKLAELLNIHATHISRYERNLTSKAQNLDKQDKDCIKSLLKAFIFQKEMQRQLVS